jgi:hypothetical protein
LFAYDTRIAVTAGDGQLIQRFEPGHRAYVASIEPAGPAIGKLGLKWDQGSVVTSTGTGTGSSSDSGNQAMVFVHYGKDGEIMVTPDHLFLTPDGRLIRADRLRAGDALVEVDGSSTTVHGVQIGLFRGGVHHISAESQPGSISLDGHLLSANGVVVADDILRINQASEGVRQYLVPDLDQRPVIGSKEYVAGGPHEPVRTPPARPTGCE